MRRWRPTARRCARMARDAASDSPGHAARGCHEHEARRARPAGKSPDRESHETAPRQFVSGGGRDPIGRCVPLQFFQRARSLSKDAAGRIGAFACLTVDASSP